MNQVISIPVWTEKDRLCQRCSTQLARADDWLCQGCRSALETNWIQLSNYNSIAAGYFIPKEYKLSELQEHLTLS